MKEIGNLLFNRYGIVAVLGVVVLGVVVWVLAHRASAPGKPVKIIWGLVEYTKPFETEGGSKTKLAETTSVGRTSAQGADSTFHLRIDYKDVTKMPKFGRGAAAILEHRDSPQNDVVAFSSIAGVALMRDDPFLQSYGKSCVESKIGNSFFLKTNSGAIWGAIIRPSGEGSIEVEFFIPEEK